MAKQEPTTVAPEVQPEVAAVVEQAVPQRTVSGDFSNPGLIEWPFDQYGFTTVLRKEGVRAIGRVNGNPEKAEVLLGTLQVLAQHLKARVPDQQAAIEQVVAAAENRAAAEQHLTLADARRKVERIKGQLAYAQEAVEALEGGEA